MFGVLQEVCFLFLETGGGGDDDNKIRIIFHWIVVAVMFVGVFKGRGWNRNKKTFFFSTTLFSSFYLDSIFHCIIIHAHGVNVFIHIWNSRAVAVQNYTKEHYNTVRTTGGPPTTHRACLRLVKKTTPIGQIT